MPGQDAGGTGHDAAGFLEKATAVSQARHGPDQVGILPVFLLQGQNHHDLAAVVFVFSQFNHAGYHFIWCFMSRRHFNLRRSLRLTAFKAEPIYNIVPLIPLPLIPPARIGKPLRLPLDGGGWVGVK